MINLFQHPRQPLQGSAKQLGRWLIPSGSLRRLMEANKVSTSTAQSLPLRNLTPISFCPSWIYPKYQTHTLPTAGLGIGGILPPLVMSYGSTTMDRPNELRVNPLPVLQQQPSSVLANAGILQERPALPYLWHLIRTPQSTLLLRSVSNWGMIF